MPSHPWKAKNALVCGASAGLGRALAEQLCEQQIASLLLVARQADSLQAVTDELQAKYPQSSIRGLTADMSSEAQVQALAARLPAEFAAFDLLIQAVGRSDRGTIQDLPRDHLLDLLDANLFSSLNAVKWLTGSLHSPGGTLLLIGSLACHFAPRFLGGYAIAKHALAGLAQQSRLELKPRGIHVMLASPGPIARADAGARYQPAKSADDLPAEALQPGGGAELKGLDPAALSARILADAARGQAVTLYPGKARLLHWLAAIAPRLGDRWLMKNTS